ncbi:hypothetical protein KFK09_005237 [Dendrobium nobile]|uniref:Uncharacterized protein n=1 Tax=Dendrobium nobile TaxID=94219 RepID=A0A8T3BXP0_DENNO|nr:hypothetical protein KFK09_005236 [Dendrobium nobile]KAI0522852.1 hypothetical protein KFK09_005237 [Dendrobium nobile]
MEEAKREIRSGLPWLVQESSKGEEEREPELGVRAGGGMPRERGFVPSKFSLLPQEEARALRSIVAAARNTRMSLLTASYRCSARGRSRATGEKDHANCPLN